MSMTKRRLILFGLGACVLEAPSMLHAQARKIFRLGILDNSVASEPRTAILTQALRELGYVEGTNLSIERRFAEGIHDRLAGLATELARLNLDVIYAPNTPSVQAAKQAAGATPIVFSVVGDPIAEGFVVSLARPGGNITGTTNLTGALNAKRLELLRDLYSGSSRVAVLVTNENPKSNSIAEVERAAQVLNMKLLAVAVRSRDDFAKVSGQLHKWHADSIYVQLSPTNFINRKLLVEFAAHTRLPAVYPLKEFAEAGGLLSYGPNVEVLYRRAAYYIDRILKGAKPADLPVEQPTTFELIVNMKTAKALGLTIPQAVLVRAERTIN